MSFDAFLALAKALGVISKELTRSEMQLLFVRANINRVDGDDRCAFIPPSCSYLHFLLPTYH